MTWIVDHSDTLLALASAVVALVVVVLRRFGVGDKTLDALDTPEVKEKLGAVADRTIDALDDPNVRVKIVDALRKSGVIVALVSLSFGPLACSGVDLGALTTAAVGHMDCVSACAACSAALAGTDAPAAEHAACALHCASCATDMAGDMAEVAEAVDDDAEASPLESDGPVCLE